MARIPYPNPATLRESTRVALATLPVRNAFSMIAHAEGLAPSTFDFVNAVFAGMTLEARLRQVAILRVGHLCNSAYEVHHHEKAGRAAGLTREEMDALKPGGNLEALGERERAVAAFAEEMTRDIRVSDRSFAAVRAFLTDRQVVELGMVTGFYNMISRMLETFDIDIEKKKEG